MNDPGKAFAAIPADWQGAARSFSWEQLWKFVDGTVEQLNITHECVDRHPGHRTALRIAFAGGTTFTCNFATLSDRVARWAGYLRQRGLGRGDRLALILQPSFDFYAALFGALKLGAVAVPLHALFGPDGVRMRMSYASPRLVVVEAETSHLVEAAGTTEADVIRLNRCGDRLGAVDPVVETCPTRPDDDALIQFTSGTTRAMPQPIHHRHRSVVTALLPGIYGYGIAPGDRYFCVSPPSWGHGLSFGTIAPLALGTAVGAWSGRFEPAGLVSALVEFGITNLSAAPTVYRQVRNSGALDAAEGVGLRKLSYTGEALDIDTFDFLLQRLGTPPCGVYGTAEASSFLGNYCGFSGYAVRPSALGKPLPGREVAVFRPDGTPAADGEIGEVRLKRRDQWYPSKDLGFRDSEGYFHIAGRGDDVIISAGWTISPYEIEDILLQHPRVLEAAVVAAPDPLRGFIPQAYVVADAGAGISAETLQAFVKRRLSAAQYPRRLEFVDAIPKTPSGKIDRAALRRRAAA